MEDLTPFFCVNATMEDLTPFFTVTPFFTGKGKRGGVRVIYYGVTDAGQIWLLAIYAKSQRESLPAHVIRLLKKQMVQS